MESINDKLKKLYEKNWGNWDNFGNLNPNEYKNISQPLLLRINDDKYSKSNVKIMVLEKKRMIGEGMKILAMI